MQDQQPTEEYPKLKHMTLDQRHKAYINWYREVVLTCFEGYWDKIFEERLADSRKKQRKFKKEKRIEWFPFLDIFQSGMNEQKKKLSCICVVPKTRFHWDAILFMYHLLFTGVFDSTSAVATYILYVITYNKVDPNKIENYDKKIHNFLINHSKGNKLENGTNNWMMVDPVYNCYMMMRGHTLLMHNLKGDEVDEDIATLYLKEHKDDEISKGEKIMRELAYILKNLYTKSDQIFYIEKQGKTESSTDFDMSIQSSQDIDHL